MKTIALRIAIIIAWGFLINFNTFCQTADYYVDADNSTPGDGTTWGLAFNHLQDALLNPDLQTGDVIWVANGTYYPDWEPVWGTIPPTGSYTGNREASFELKDEIKLYGGFVGSETSLEERVSWEIHETILSGDIGVSGVVSDNSMLIVHAENMDNIAINGFYISNGYDILGSYGNEYGSALTYKNVSGILQNCIIENNKGFCDVLIEESVIELNNCQFLNNYCSEATFKCYLSDINVSNCLFQENITTWPDDLLTSGILVSNSNIVIDQCRFVSNQGDPGIAVIYIENRYHGFYESNALIENSVFESNDVWAISIQYVDDNGSSETLIRNCVFNSNYGAIGADIYNESSVDIVNCSFYMNELYTISGQIMEDSEVNVTNSILWDGGGENEFYLSPYSDKGFNVSYCDIHPPNPYPGNNNINVDPLFTNPSNNDFHISASSGCINKGNNNVPELPLFDFEGNDRIIFDIVDIGADESMSYAIYVDSSAAPGGDGATWETAFDDLQDGLEVAQSGCQIWVAKGTYYPSVNPIQGDEEFFALLSEVDQINTLNPVNEVSWQYIDTNSFKYYDIRNYTKGDPKMASFKMLNGVSLFGGFEGFESRIEQKNWRTNKTRLSGNIQNPEINTDNCYHVLYSYNIYNEAILDGFHIIDGYAPNNASYTGVGAGMYAYNSNLDIDSCLIKDNYCYVYGAGIYLASSTLDLDSCTFFDNDVYFVGGGICNFNSTINATNSSFINNSAALGAGIFNANLGYCNVHYSLFDGNLAYEYAGAIYLSQHMTSEVVNCIFAGNVAVNTSGGFGGGAIFNASSVIDIINSTFHNNQTNQTGASIYTYQQSGWNIPSSTIINSIMWGYEILPDQIFGSNYTTVSFSDIIQEIGQIYTGDENINNDPLFANPEISDLHLRSSAFEGRWDPLHEVWVQDDDCSPCIDKGHPDFPCTDEPIPNGDIINMGAYGNTNQASKTCDLGKDHDTQNELSSENHSFGATYSLTPNPFNHILNIDIQIPEDCSVNITVYNSNGLKVRVISDSYFISGEHTISWNGTDDNSNSLPNGLYLLTIKTNNSYQGYKVILNK